MIFEEGKQIETRFGLIRERFFVIGEVYGKVRCWKYIGGKQIEFAYDAQDVVPINGVRRYSDRMATRVVVA